MKTMILILGFILPSVSFGLNKNDRIANFYQSIDEKDEAIPEGKAILKMNLNELEANIQYRKKKDEIWTDWMPYKQNSARMLVDTLSAGNYRFKWEKPGKDPVYGNVNLDSQHYVEVAINFFETREIEYKVYKPAIYLYSDQPVDLQLKINPAGKFDFTYPIHQENGWEVHVDQNGMTCDGEPYDYLFWDATQGKMDFNYNLGFVFKGDETTDFLEQKLSAMGLNDREKQDFIAFWGPKLSVNEFNYVHFICDEAYSETIGGIESSKEFDSSLRIFMGYKALSNSIPVIEQDLKGFNRNGLTLVEWGGGEVFIQQLGL